jgi:hypothetical protein
MSGDMAIVLFSEMSRLATTGATAIAHVSSTKEAMESQLGRIGRFEIPEAASGPWMTSGVL